MTRRAKAALIAGASGSAALTKQPAPSGERQRQATRRSLVSAPFRCTAAACAHNCGLASAGESQVLACMWPQSCMYQAAAQTHALKVSAACQELHASAPAVSMRSLSLLGFWGESLLSHRPGCCTTMLNNSLLELAFPSQHHLVQGWKALKRLRQLALLQSRARRSGIAARRTPVVQALPAAPQPLLGSSSGLGLLLLSLPPAMPPSPAPRSDRPRGRLRLGQTWLAPAQRSTWSQVCRQQHLCAPISTPSTPIVLLWGMPPAGQVLPCLPRACLCTSGQASSLLSCDQ